MRTFLAVLGLCAALSGCRGAPKCSNAQVQETVIELFRKYLIKTHWLSNAWMFRYFNVGLDPQDIERAAAQMAATASPEEKAKYLVALRDFRDRGTLFGPRVCAAVARVEKTPGVNPDDSIWFRDGPKEVEITYTVETSDQGTVSVTLENEP